MMQKFKKPAASKTNAFSVFTNEFLKEYRNKTGRSYVGGFNAAMNDPELKSRWDNLSPEEKEEWKARAKTEKARSRNAYAAGLAAMEPTNFDTTDNGDSQWASENDGFGAEDINERRSSEKETAQNNNQRPESRASSQGSKKSQDAEAPPATGNSRFVGSGSFGQVPVDNGFGSSLQFAQTRAPNNQESIQGIQNASTTAITSNVQSVTAIGCGDYEAAGLEDPDEDDEGGDLMGDIDERTEDDKDIETFPFTTVSTPPAIATVVPVHTADASDSVDTIPAEHAEEVAIPVTAPASATVDTIQGDNAQYEDVDESAQTDEGVQTDEVVQTEEIIAVAPAPVDAIIPMDESSKVQVPLIENPDNMLAWAQNGINGWTQDFRDDYLVQLKMPHGCRGLGRGQHFLPQMAALESTLHEFLNGHQSV